MNAGVLNESLRRHFPATAIVIAQTEKYNSPRPLGGTLQILVDPALLCVTLPADFSSKGKYLERTLNENPKAIFRRKIFVNLEGEFRPLYASLVSHIARGRVFRSR